MSLVRTAKKIPKVAQYEVKYLYHDHPFLNEGIEKYMEAATLKLDLSELKKPRANEENPQSLWNKLWINVSKASKSIALIYCQICLLTP